jgi:hypothetical protein
MVSHHRVVRDTAESAVVRMIKMMAVAMPLVALLQVLANLRDYRQPALAAAVWLAVLASAAWFLPRMRVSGLTRGESAAAQLTSVAAVAALSWDHRQQRAADLAIFGTAWLLALAALSRPPRDWVLGPVAVFAVHSALIVRAVGANPLSLAQLEASGYILGVVMIAFAALRPTLAVLTGVNVRRAVLASRSAAERAAAAAVQAERRDRLALLEMEALPLLRAIADGTLDPTADEVRERCAWHAAVLRQRLTQRTLGGLVAGLEPALRAARARGLLVDVQLIGDPGMPPPEVARAVLATVDAVISVLPPHQVTLTVLASGDDVELYLTFSEPPRVAPDLPGWDVPVAVELGPGCLEISWPREGGSVALDRCH